MKLLLIRGILFLLPACLLTTALPAQPSIPLGTWRTHFSYQSVHEISLAGDRIYAAAENGLFFYDQQDNSLNPLSRLDGLSDTGVAALVYNQASDVLIIAYRSGVVDAISGQQRAAFTLLRDERQNEQINDVFILGRRVFLATSEGVRVLLLEDSPDDFNLRILESYTRLGSEGEALAVSDVSVLGDSLFLATPEGVIANALDPSVNRQDFSSWRRFTPADGLPAGAVSSLAEWQGNMYAAFDRSGLYRYRHGAWRTQPLTTTRNFRSLLANDEALTAVAGDSIFVLTSADELTFTPSVQPQEAVFHGGTLWVGDAEAGLLRLRGTGTERLIPNGPLSDSIYNLQYENGELIALAEGGAAFSIFRQGRWINYSEEAISTALEGQPLSPLVDAAYLPAEDAVYFASAGSGLLRLQEGAFRLLKAGEGNSLDSELLSAVAVTAEGRLWVANYGEAAALHRFDPVEEVWTSFSPGTNFPLNITPTADGQLWLLGGQGGVLSKTGREITIYDPEEQASARVPRLLPPASLPGDIFTEVLNDREGLIWLGGNEGIAYIPNPFSFVEDPNAIKPIFENQFLLFGDYISAIAVDGGDRKWVGTRNGLWLFGPDGESLVERFTTANSPLPADTILDISINDKSGEVFFLTTGGLVSYRSGASGAQQEHTDVRIFPNPVPPGFTGEVGMSGLTRDAIIKITTIAGTLVRELEAEGGTASWNVRDYNGSRVGSGVYLVFSASADGSQTFVGKVVVVN
jgi:streptogramin lyase